MRLFKQLQRSLNLWKQFRFDHFSDSQLPIKGWEPALQQALRLLSLHEDWRLACKTSMREADELLGGPGELKCQSSKSPSSMLETHARVDEDQLDRHESRGDYERH